MKEAVREIIERTREAYRGEVMSERLSAEEMAEMVGCKPNQRSIMVRWLEDRRWKFDTDRNGLPIVMRAYRDRKLGITEDKQSAKYADAPNLQAFAA